MDLLVGLRNTETMDSEELLSGVHARLLPAGSITPEIAGALTYARRISDDLVFAYALDRPADIRILTDPDVAHVDPEELGRAAYENLMRVPVTHEEIPHEGTVLHSLHGDSHFVASKALYLAAAVHRATGASLPHEGALVVMPSRHNLVYHPIADGTVVDAVNALASYGLGAYEDSHGRGALSPRLYWWHRGGLTSLTVIDEEARRFSVQPPPELLALMKGLVGLDRAGRIPGRATAGTPDPAGLTARAAESMTALSPSPAPAALEAAFSTVVQLAHARCAADPRASSGFTWAAWATAVQLGTALFTGTDQALDCHLDEDLVRPLPAGPAAPPADARAWLDALYLAVLCRQRDRVRRLCAVPMERLREDDSVDPYVLHWADTLRTYFSDDGSMDDVVAKLGATIEASGPGVTHAPRTFVDAIDYQPVALFHRLITRDHDTFAKTLTEALAEHRSYWGGSAAPRARVALGPLALASLAHDWGFPLPEDLPFLPVHLLDGQRIEHIP